MSDSNLSWLSAADTVDQETVESFGPQYPLIQWVNGNPKAKKAGGVEYTGGWFINAEQLSSDELLGWESGELVHDKGGSTLGFFSRDVTIAMIHTRHAWRVYNGERSVNFAWNQFDAAAQIGRPTGRLQVLCVVRGLEGFGPFVLTMKGSTGQAFAGNRQNEGAIGAFNRLVIRPANALAVKTSANRAKFPWRAFWLTVGPQRNDKGEPTFTEVGTKPNTSMVTLPAAIGLPEKAAPADLFKLFVGKDNLESFNGLYNEARDWAAAWDVIAPQAAKLETEEPDTDLPEGLADALQETSVLF
jgi:hypothetical protein